MGLNKRQNVRVIVDSGLESAKAPSRDPNDRFREVNYYICRKCNIQLSLRATWLFHCILSAYPLFCIYHSNQCHQSKNIRSRPLYARTRRLYAFYSYNKLNADTIITFSEYFRKRIRNVLLLIVLLLIKKIDSFTDCSCPCASNVTNACKWIIALLAVSIYFHHNITQTQIYSPAIIFSTVATFLLRGNR